MYIQRAHIDGFGVLAGQTIPQLPQGLSIFLGSNEAGKSTCLDFFRAMLAGYPRSRAAHRVPLSGRAADAGGTLTLHTDRCGVVRLTRRPGAHGGTLTFTDANGTPLDAELAAALLHGVTPDLYRNIYGFSLSELQEFSSLSAEGARNVLLGAGAGQGLRPPSQLLDDLAGRMGALYLPEGRKPPLNEALKELETLRATLRTHERDTARYDALSAELDDLTARLAGVRAERAGREAEHRALERRLGVWRQWQELVAVEGQLARLDVVVERFPQDGKARFERERERAAERGLRAQGLRTQLAALEATLTQRTPDARLLAAAPELRALLERKASYRNARASLPALMADLERNRADRERLLAALGADWTPERVRGFDRSLFTREAIAAHEAATDTVGADLRQARAERDRRAVEHEAARHAAELAHAQADALGADPADTLGAEQAEQLRTLRAQAGAALAELPGLRAERGVQAAALARSLADISPGWTPDTLRGLDTSPRAREAVTARARAVTDAADAAREAARRADELAAQLGDLSARYDQAIVAARAIAAPSREDLDRRAEAVRRLRRVADGLALEAEREAEAARAERDHAANAPAVRKSMVLLALGGTLLAAGAVFSGLLLAVLRGALDISAASSLTWLSGLAPFAAMGLAPVYLCGVAALCGLALLATGWPRRDAAEQAAHAARAARLVARHQELAERRDALRADAARLLREAGVSDADASPRMSAPDGSSPAGSALADRVDMTERTLERARDERARRDRADAEATAREADCATLRTRHMQALHTREAAEAALHQARADWAAHRAALGLPESFTPEAAPGLFDRVEACTARAAQADALTARVTALAAQVAALADAARAVPALAPLCPQGQEGDDTTAAALLAGVDRLLADLRTAEARRQERERALAELAARREREQQALTAVQEADAALQTATVAAGAATDAWRAWLAQRGLSPDLTPATTRDALVVMDDWLRLDNEATGLATRRAALDAELAALETPLVRIAADCANALPDAARRDDPLAAPTMLTTLDALAAAAEAAVSMAAERDGLAARQAELLIDLHEAEAAHGAAMYAVAELLTAGDAMDEEDFLRRAASFAERQELLRRRGDLTDHLAAALPESTTGAVAPDGLTDEPDGAPVSLPADPLAALRAELATADREAMQARCDELATELTTLAAQEAELVDMAAALRVQRDQVTTADEVAALRRQEAALLESARQMALEWSRNALARHLIDTARRRFERERQPHVIREAAAIFRTITGGRWQSIAASLEDGVPRAVPADGEPVPHEHLSRGTREQLYLALRLGYVRTHALHAEPLPLIMDDILVNFDPERAARTAAALAELCGKRDGRDGVPPDAADEAPNGAATIAGGKPHQILFFTCHPHTVDMLRTAAPDAALFTVERGSITAA